MSARAKRKQKQTEPPQPASTTVEDVSARVDVCEEWVGELVKSCQAAGGAINRLESYLFSLIKLLIESGVPFDVLLEFQKELQDHTSLHDFWGVNEILGSDGETSKKAADADEEVPEEEPAEAEDE